MTPRRLVADAGGTNVRFAIADESGGLQHVRTYHVSGFKTFAEGLSAYRTDTDGLRDIASCVIAAAGPVEGDAVKLTNNDWTISRQETSALLAGIPVALVNDLEAVAAALPHLTAKDLTTIGSLAPARPERRTMLAVNVGTGFGAASVIHHNGRWNTCPSEAGHMTLVTAETLAALPARASVETILSGGGLVQLYEQLAKDQRPLARDAASVLAHSRDDNHAARAVAIFTDILARIAGDLVLATCAWGGVYLCGSVAVAWSAIADSERFRAEFTRKGLMRDRMLRVPTAVIQHDNVALFGLAMMPLTR
jgi:glucokinase